MKLIITVGGEDHTLSMEAAKELYEELGRVFQKEVVIRTNPLPVPVYPIVKPWWEYIPSWQTRTGFLPETSVKWSSSDREVSMQMVS